MQSTTRPAVHHLPLGQVNLTTFLTVVCTAAPDITFTALLSAVPNAVPSAAFVKATMAVRMSSAPAVTNVPSSPEYSEAMTTAIVRLSASWRERCRRRREHGSGNVMSRASRSYSVASAVLTASYSKSTQPRCRV